MKMKRWAENIIYVPELRDEAKAWAQVRGFLDDVPINGWLYEKPSGKVCLLVFNLDESGTVKIDFDRHLPMMKWVEVDGPMPGDHLIEAVDGTTIDDWAQMTMAELAE